MGALAFTSPLLLAGLVALPILWLILRAIPPAPIRRRFPGVALLIGLSDERPQADRTPWWLLALRMLAAALVIAGFAGPVLNPEAPRGGSGPLLVLMDGTWADARDWPQRSDRVESLLAEAGRTGRPVAVVLTTDLPPGPLPLRAAADWADRLPGLRPAPHVPAPGTVVAWAETLPEGIETWWFSDGLAHPDRAPLLERLRARGPVTVFEGALPVLALRPPRFAGSEITLTALRSPPGPEAEITVHAIGRDPAGVERVLTGTTARFDAGADSAELVLTPPAELRNRLTRFEIAGQRSAGAVALADDSLRRREVGLLAARDGREGLALLSPLHYLRQALEPAADLVEGDLADLIRANPDAIVLADIAVIPPAQAEALGAWIEAGGTLLRFAGPRVAAAEVGRGALDPLMPVVLRQGGRVVGGAMSWGTPRSLAPFVEGSPFHGLEVPQEVVVRAQVLAEPDPELPARTLAALEDGTPLVTRRAIGAGQVVLVHVTANAEWSSLPLSGLFVQMLDRLILASRQTGADAAALEGTVWTAQSLLDAYGRPTDPGRLAGIAGPRLADPVAAADLAPGQYAGPDRVIAVNVSGPETRLAPANWPAIQRVEGLGGPRQTDLKGGVLLAALALLAADLLATLWLSGRLWRGAATALLALGLLALPGAPQAQTATPAAPPPDPQAELRALLATSEVVLAHVLTGDPAVDRVAEAGLRGLGLILAQRTSIEPGAPMGVDLERDELAFFPFLYWPVTADQPIPSDAAYARLNRYLRTGGMILFDTRDAGFGGQTPEGARLRRLALPLDLPPLEPVPADHVLTRAFYLIQDFPGRHDSPDVWVEAAPPDADRAEGMPFRNLNDGVTPVVIGGNDWAGAWAMDQTGRALLPVGRGYGGERQREIAYRFGVNLIMHVLTGNYKSDQVHVPALLDRLGQ